ncbi:MAG: hypothetical protein ICV65_09695 [Flavisolibacter sp.]|nr:hypothetical protein [Flavisolibacter sp.]
MKKWVLLVSTFCSLAIAFCTNAQQIDDSALYQDAVKNLIRLYTSRQGENIHIYNGPEHIQIYPGIAGTPFFNPNEKEKDPFQIGTVYYDGVLYPDVRIAYDIVKDELIVKNHQNVSIELNKQRVGYFSLYGHTFIALASDKSATDIGFLEVVYDDATMTIYESRTKQPVRMLLPTDHYEFKEQDNFIVKKGNTTFPVTSRNSFIALFGDQQEEIKRFIRKNKFNFKSDIESAILKTTRYYKQLKNG